MSERIGETTNNVAEYQALIAGLEAAARDPVAHGAGARRLEAGDRAGRGRWKVKQAHLRAAATRVRARCSSATTRSTSRHVPREQNTEADALVNAALDLP